MAYVNKSFDISGFCQYNKTIHGLCHAKKCIGGLTMEKWKCTVCGYIHEGPLPEDFKCPVCKQPASVFVKIEEAPAKNPYAGTKTEKNLWEAFAGESQARNKYTYFASVAKKQGFEQISALFLQTAENEKEHAKLWFKLLHGLAKLPIRLPI